MFELQTLTLYSFDKRSFTYKFRPGINYVEGPNSTGKTAFLEFLDYMLGHGDENISKCQWYAGTLMGAKLTLSDGSRCLELSRTLDGERYKVCLNGISSDAGSLNEYTNEVNSILWNSQSALMDFWKYAGEEITYRTFTLFNFLEENHVGHLNDFFGRLRDVRYRVKERVLFDYLFNDNIPKVLALEKEIENLNDERQRLLVKTSESKALESKIDSELAQLGIQGSIEKLGIDGVKGALGAFDISSPDEESSSFGIADSTHAAATLADQIKALEKMLSERSMEAHANENRLQLLNRLDQLIAEKAEYKELLGPTHGLIANLESSLSMKDVQAQRDVLSRKRKLLETLRMGLRASGAVLNPVDVSERFRLATLLTEHISQYEAIDGQSRLEEVQKELKRARKSLRELRLKTNEARINEISNVITRLYRSARQSSKFVREDFELEGFGVKYVRNGNLIQPFFDQNNVPTNYYTGSRARHALLQLSGYLAFIKMLCSRPDCPALPFLFADNISAPFDDENAKGIGDILQAFYSESEVKEFQVFLFENRAPGELGVKPANHIKLVSERRTGFNPFYPPTGSSSVQ